MKEKKAIYMVVLILIIAHFSIIVLYNFRDKNLSSGKLQKTLSLTTRYVNPLFEQTWSMFAPNPPVSTFSCLFKFRVKRRSGQVIETEYLDIHEPVVLAGRKSIFSLDQRLLKYMHGCTMDMISKTNTYKKKNNNKADSHRVALQTYLARKSYGYMCLKEYAKNVYGNLNIKEEGDQQTYFKLKIFNDQFPGFEHRELDYTDVKLHTYSAMEIGYNALNYEQ